MPIGFSVTDKATKAVGLCCVLLGALLFFVTDVLAGERLSIFSGEWRGRGNLVLETGKKERVLCRMSVKTSSEHREARQVIQCASTGRDVIVRSKLSLAGVRVSGTYEEQSIGSQGNLDGLLKGNRLQLTMGGPDVSAAIVSIASGNRQTINVTGRVGTITKMSLTLKRSGR